MDIDIFTILGLILGAWVVLSPGWRLAGLRRQRGLLEEPLIENAQAENETDLTYWLPSWFFLSVAVMTFWCWFFWGVSKIPKSKSEDSWLWSDLNTLIQIMIPFTIIFSIVWLVWLCLINYEETLLCVAGGILGFIIVSGLTLLFEGSDRLHVLGFIAVALTVASNFCRMKSSGIPQVSILGFSVAIAGFIGGLLWIPKGYLVDSFSAGADNHKFLSVLFKKFFFWKLSSTAGSLFRGRDLVILMILWAREPRNLHVNIEQSWSWFLQKVASGSGSLQLKMGPTWLQFRHRVTGSTDAQI